MMKDCNIIREKPISFHWARHTFSTLFLTELVLSVIGFDIVIIYLKSDISMGWLALYIYNHSHLHLPFYR